jgi:cytoplasmic iron level regulating protein YaaA (DUF328/UPF0246 family)
MSEPSRPLADGYGLTSTRRLILEGIRRLCVERPDLATRLLQLPLAIAPAALAANSAVWDAPTMPALDRFTGVLFDAFAPGTLTRAARAAAEESVLIFDGAFGVLTGAEPVPDHRVPAGASLPDLGGIAALWRPVLARALPPLLAGHVVVDLRSSDYAAMWRPTSEGVLPVRILVERRDGQTRRRSVLSVPSKVGKGRLARALCSTRRKVRTADDVARVATAAGFTVVPARRGLDLVFDFVPKGAQAST